MPPSLSPSLSLTHFPSFTYLLVLCLLAWPHHTKEGGCIQELKPAAADIRAKGRGRLIHRRLWRGGGAVVGAGSRREPLLFAWPLREACTALLSVH